MSRLSFPKKLLPVRQAWKGLASGLRSKLTKLKESKLIRTTTHRILSSKFLHRLFVPFKRRSLAKTSNFCHFQPRLYQYYRNNCPSIYIDELFEDDERHGPSWNSSRRVPVDHEKGETSNGREEARAKPSELVGNQRREGKVAYDVDEVWRNIVASSPQLRCVDERAEDFISKIKEDMKLQRERSILEFQEMLKRSA
ncbi:uncharacterized protein LOC116207092 [Punica granatum]|uniref:Uncharacterized protein LOC116207092 n=2 Tax=Punica granatum TaxID=22663 RepID=A0A6P8DEY2_PUNGR|nr:uncharacterized protein LOC116207092 [Punica granatum]XP_031395813.1 uncharacterized protein LOC116207092 [Punica granatum]OWM70455.1 hypothetical protein CDL15_Pgr011931 [Punica granatum]PKI65849.1 hypothetical protein CRG98_013753 [Punica granatum]